MEQAWFNAILYGWLPGTIIGCLGGIIGTAAGVLAPRGKARRFVLSLQLSAIVISAAFLAAGVAALAASQPYAVWYSLLLPGIGGSVLFCALFPLLRRSYAQAEMRKSKAADL